jgi:hypothetical protein
MSNYNPLQLVQKNSQPLHLRIPCNDENVKFLGEKLLVLFFRFFRQNKEGCENQRRDRPWKIMCLLFGPNWVALKTNALEPWPMSFPMLLSKK